MLLFGVSISKLISSLIKLILENGFYIGLLYSVFMKQKITSTEDGMLRRVFLLMLNSSASTNQMRFENPHQEIVRRKEEWPKEYSELAFDKIIWYHSKQSKLQRLGLSDMDRGDSTILTYVKSIVYSQEKFRKYQKIVSPGTVKLDQ